MLYVPELMDLWTDIVKGLPKSIRVRIQ